MTEQTKMLPCSLGSDPKLDELMVLVAVSAAVASGNGYDLGVLKSEAKRAADLWEARAPDPEAAKLIEALVEALTELTDCGAEAWGEERPCVQQARAALTLTRRA